MLPRAHNTRILLHMIHIIHDRRSGPATNAPSSGIKAAWRGRRQPRRRRGAASPAARLLVRPDPRRRHCGIPRHAPSGASHVSPVMLWATRVLSMQARPNVTETVHEALATVTAPARNTGRAAVCSNSSSSSSSSSGRQRQRLTDRKDRAFRARRCCRALLS